MGERVADGDAREGLDGISPSIRAINNLADRYPDDENIQMAAAAAEIALNEAEALNRAAILAFEQLKELVLEQQAQGPLNMWEAGQRPGRPAPHLEM